MNINWKDFGEKNREIYEQSRTEWTTRCSNLFNDFQTAKPEKISVLEANSLSMRQNLTDEISFFKAQMSQMDEWYKQAKWNKVIDYANPSPELKKIFGTRSTDRKIALASDMRHVERAMTEIKDYLDFLIDTRDVLKSFVYSVKNKLEAWSLMVDK